MSNNLSLSKLTLIYGVANVFSKGLTFVVFFIFTFFLKKEEIGIFDLVLTSFTLVVPLVALQLYDGILRWCLNLEKDSIEVSKILSSVTVAVFLNLVCFSIVYWILALIVDIPFSFIIYLFLICQVIYTIVLQFARSISLNFVYAFSGVLYSGVFAIGSLIVILVSDFGLKGIIFANLFSSFVGVLYLLYKTKFVSYFSFSAFDLTLLRSMLHYTIPLIPNQIGWWAVSESNRYMILYFLGIGANGLFAIAMKFPNILLVLHLIFNQAWQEKVIRLFGTAESKEYFDNVIAKYLKLILGLTAIAIGFSKLLLPYIVNRNYFEVGHYLPLFYFAVCFQALGSFYGGGYLAAKKTKGAFYTTIVGALVNITLNFILIPYLGLMGCAISLFAGNVALFTARYVHSRSFFEIDFPIRSLLVNLIFLITFSIFSISNVAWVLGLNAFGCVLYCAYLNRNMLNRNVRFGLSQLAKVTKK
ncbi:lipopolysaccharide biosynthesis protein [Leptospira licerasiae]|uniref:Polysaccharide biosynthesis protein n=1 Tax=Leptospira licerasiae str. MMD4847 TaxID=1049971 RepID=A0ABN0H712_9LEPT|nr:polysaccharide biosynthesis C-terminal domain-containing protein [Leptospira licerasiae]EIE02394.1 polysaccharide biosynthesis protein [Leptospira licerasiae serovar Varillal str. VAR 010]EJZ41291.1 polysaccharide biosynthesis protein [Leptospira licerasiae str. MMD4847]